MFDRTRVDNVVIPQSSPTAEVTLEDGRRLAGTFVIPASKTLFDVLNGAGGFIDFAPFDGERQYIAKDTLKAVKLIPVPPADRLADRSDAVPGFDPHAVLGLKRGADWDDVRRAYHDLSKRYHPDRYAAAELPDEVTDYLAAMARRVNAAFAVLEQNRQQSRIVETLRPQPVFETRGRG